MKFFRKSGKLNLFVVIILVASFLLAGCGETVPIDEVVDPVDPVDEEELGELKVGMVLAMTGAGSWYGVVMSRGAQLAVDILNEESNIGYELELIIEDHQSGDPDPAAAGTRKLLDIDRTPVVLSSFTAPGLAIQALTSERDVLTINGGGVGSALVGLDAFYNTRMLGTQVMPGIVDWAVNEHGVERIATLFWNDAAGHGVNDAIKETAEALGVEVVAEEPHDIGLTDYSSQLSRIRAANPDIIITGTWGNDVGYIVNQAREMGIDCLIGGNEWTPDAQEIGGEPMEGYVVAMDRFDAESPDPITQEFVKAYEAEYGELPEFYGANYYEIVRYIVGPLIKEALDRGLDPNEFGVLLELLEGKIEAGETFTSVYGGEMRLLPNGTVLKPASLYEIVDGQLSLVGLIIEGKVEVQ